MNTGYTKPELEQLIQMQLDRIVALQHAYETMKGKNEVLNYTISKLEKELSKYKNRELDG